jgi:O-antigen/teichoic acid export membrane protein
MPLTLRRNGRQLTADFSWVLIGNIVYAASQWAIVVALAKLGSTSQVGQYALGMAVSAPVVLFANLQLRALLASEVQDRFAFGQYLSLRLATLSAALFVVAAAACTQRDWRVRAIVTLVGLAQAIEFLSEIYYGFMQKHGRMDRVSLSLMLRGPLSLAALYAVMSRTHSVVWALVALVSVRALVLLTWDIRLGFVQATVTSPASDASATRITWNGRTMLSLLWLALPLGVISMLVSLNSNLPRYFLEAHSGPAELGIFSALASLLTAGNLVVSALGQSIFVPVAQACAEANRARLRSYSIAALLIGAVLGGVAVAGAALFGREVLTRIFRPEYSEHASALVRLTVAGTITFMGSGIGYIVTAARRLHSQIPVLIASAVAAAAVSASSIPTHGLNGAADAVLAAGFVQLVGTGAILWKIDRGLLNRRFENQPVFVADV